MSDDNTPLSGEDQSPPDPDLAAPRSGGDPRFADDQPARDNVTEDHVMIDAGEDEPEKSDEVVVNGEKPTMAPLEVSSNDSAGVVLSPPSRQLKADAQSSPVTNGSPSAEEVQEAPTSAKEDKVIALLSEILQNTTPGIAQKVLREHWRLFLFSKHSSTHDLNHITFVLRAALKNAPPSVIEQVISLGGFFSPEVVQILSKKKEVVKAVLGSASTNQIKDLVSPSILHQVLIDQIKKIPKEILSQIMAEHIKKVPAKQLVEMLANGNRLGYKSSDVIDPEDESVMPDISTIATNEEYVVEPSNSQRYSPAVPHNQHPAPPTDPQNQYSPTVLSHRNLAPAIADPLLAEQERNLALQRQAAAAAATGKPAPKNKKLKGGSFVNHFPAPPGRQCPSCSATLPTDSGYFFHTDKNVCSKENAPTMGWRWKCPNCLLGFTAKQGLVYHRIKNVCKDDRISNTLAPTQTETEAEHATRAVPPTPTQPNKRPYGKVQDPKPRVPDHQSLQTSHPTVTQAPRTSQGAQASQAAPRTTQPTLALQLQLLPPLRTPSTKKANHQSSSITRTQDSDVISPRIYMSPSELPPEKLTEMNKLIADQETRYQCQVREVDSTEYPTPDAVAKRLSSLKASNATRNSQIRKSFGVTLRMRDKDKKVMAAQQKSAVPRPSLEAFRHPPTSGTSTPRTMTAQSTGTPAHSSSPIISGFSPVNAPQKASSQPMQSGTHVSSYGQPPPTMSQGKYNSTYNKSSGPENPPHQYAVGAYKRQRTGEAASSPGSGSPYSPYQPPQQLSQQPGLFMAELHSEDAATRIAQNKAKKVPVGQAQSKWQALHGAPPVNGTTSGKVISSSKPQVLIPLSPPPDGFITILSSDSEGSSDIEATKPGKKMALEHGRSPDEPVPSVEV